MIIRISTTAIHEAGHAVVAAHLRLGLTHVTIKPKRDGAGYTRVKPFRPHLMTSDRKGGPLRLCSESELKREHSAYLEKRAIMILAARAAVDMLSEDHEIPEDAYTDDERRLREFAEPLDIPPSGFDAWRGAVLGRARRLVGLPHIRAAVKNVAADLQYHYNQYKKGISGHRVHLRLRVAEIDAQRGGEQ